MVIACKKLTWFQRPYLVLENMFIAPLGFLIPQLLVSFADNLNNPSLTFCPAIIAAVINCALIGIIYKKDALKKQSAWKVRIS